MNLQPAIKLCVGDMFLMNRESLLQFLDSMPTKFRPKISKCGCGCGDFIVEHDELSESICCIGHSVMERKLKDILSRKG